jgi:hypothetical protein
LNPDWPQEKSPPSISKFQVRKYSHYGLDYWSPLDLLGLFLSSIGPAPQGATKRNFFLPMTAIYGRWCQAICQAPYVFQCTWREMENEQAPFFLGAALGGYRWDLEQTGTWEHVLRQARFNLVNGEPLKLRGWSYNTSPEITRREDRGTRFGNCGEKYPFLALLKFAL